CRVALYPGSNLDFPVVACKDARGRLVMYAGHFAAGLALRGRAPRVPVTVLLIGVFILDFLWVVFGVLHWETPRDDWSHSLLMSILGASLFAAAFWRFGIKACVVIWLAVFSHFVLD